MVKNLLCFFFLMLLPIGIRAAELTYEIRGLDEPLLSNVRNHLEAFQLMSNEGRTSAQYEKLVEDAEERARAGLRPYGYYTPIIDTELKTTGSNNRTVLLQIDLGTPVIVSAVHVQVVGEGKGYAPLRDWQANWPLPVGSILNQTLWEDHKQDAIEVAAAEGYLQAEYAQQTIDLNLIQNQARLTLILDTGRRSVMGKITYDQDVVRPFVLDNVPRFTEGDHYTTYLMEEFRTDLWKTGYFTDVEVVEKQRADVDPPIVDLEVRLRTDTRDTYQGLLGVGSDTGPRVQASWSRHPASSFGDRIDVALGWQQTDNEILLRPVYRIPRRTAQRQYWVADLLLKMEKQDFEFKERLEDDVAIRVGDGRVNDFSLKAGRLKVRNPRASRDQAFETIFARYLYEDRQITLFQDIPPELFPVTQDPDFQRRLQDTTSTLSFGIEWDHPVVRGKGFQTVGRRDQAWFLASNEAWGSDTEFYQVYISTNHNYMIGDRWKLLVRAEAGYTDAKVDKYTVTVDGRNINLGLTRLPNLYRFEAGGSRSVRGYGFEGLSANDLGSNNIFTASAEVEMKFLKNWSVALFYDIGNAFNDWSKPDLKRGIGFGIRWYTIAGAIRVDFARAEDFEGKPWRLHITMGVPLL